MHLASSPRRQVPPRGQQPCRADGASRDMVHGSAARRPSGRSVLVRIAKLGTDKLRRPLGCAEVRLTARRERARSLVISRHSLTALLSCVRESAACALGLFSSPFFLAGCCGESADSGGWWCVCVWGSEGGGGSPRAPTHIKRWLIGCDVTARRNRFVLV